MKRRLLPLALVIASSIVYACSDSSDDAPTNPDTTPEGGSGADTSTTDPDAATNPDTSTGDSSVPPTGNPIEGVGAPVAIPSVAALYAIGPVWRTDTLYFSEFKPDGVLIKLKPPANTPEPFRAAPLTAGYELLGSTFDEKGNSFVTCEVAAGPGARGGQIVRTTAAGVASAVAVNFDAGVMFDSPKNVVARKTDGTLYITDPGYQVDPQNLITTNHIWRIKPNGDIFETQVTGRPNGIAFAPGQASLYVSFTDAPSKITKYPIAADGALGAGTPFAAVAPADSTADGLAVDASGNVYVAVKTGVDVFKPDGSKWGHIGTKAVSDLAFGGADKKTLYMTNNNGAVGAGISTVTVKIAGQ